MEENRSVDADKIEQALAGIELASRWDRLWASIIDGLMIMAVTIPLIYFTGGFDDSKEPSLVYLLLVTLVATAVFFLINGKLLASSGQTVGKRFLGIKIVALDGAKADVQPHLIKRYAFYMMIGVLPVIGTILSNINILFIFGKSKRCLHDHIAATKVIDC